MQHTCLTTNYVINVDKANTQQRLVKHSLLASGGKLAITGYRTTFGHPEKTSSPAGTGSNMQPETVLLLEKRISINVCSHSVLLLQEWVGINHHSLIVHQEWIGIYFHATLLDNLWMTI
jgi:hypothetical protein